MIEYVILGIIFSTILFFAIVKLKYPFWNLQPVLHTYDWFRRCGCFWFYGTTPFVIFPSSWRPNTKYLDLGQYETRNYEELPPETKTGVVSLLRKAYYSADNILFLATDIWLDAMMVGHNQPSFVTTTNISPTAIMFSTPIEIYLPQVGKPQQPIWGNYMDLVVAPTAPERLFQTHEYNNCKLNPLGGGNITLFKKEVTLYEGIVPFVSTQLYTFAVADINQLVTVAKIPISTSLRMVGKKGSHAQYMMDFLRSQKGNTLMVSVGVGAIMHRIKMGYWFVFVLVENQTDALLGIYFFRDVNCIYEEASSIDANTRCVELMGSFCNTAQIGVFVNGFSMAVRELTRKINLDYRLLMVADIGHNRHILEILTITKGSPLAYYWYNYCFVSSPTLIDIMILV